jgi:hypothetical protein
MKKSTFRLVIFCAVLAGGLFWMAAAKADTVAAFQLNGAFNSFNALDSAPSVGNLTYSKGSQLTVWGYIDSSYIQGFSRSDDVAVALNAGNWLEFSFDTGNAPIIFDQFYMNNDYVVFPDTFKMGLAYNNGGGAFSEILSGILPADINSGIDISKFSAGLANSTIQFLVIFYDDTRLNPNSALFPKNSTLGGVDNSVVVFTGAIPEPSAFVLLGLGLAATGLCCRQRKV